MGPNEGNRTSECASQFCLTCACLYFWLCVNAPIERGPFTAHKTTVQAMAADTRSAHWIDFSGQDNNGKHVLFAWKAWRYSNGDENMAAWEARRVATSLLGSASGTINRLVRKLFEAWEPYLVALSKDPAEHLFRSQRSEVFRVRRGCAKTSAELEPFLRGEWSASTCGIIIGLLHESVKRKKHDQRKKALAVMESWFRVFMNPDTEPALDFGEVWSPNVVELCKSGDPHRLTCRHARQPFQKPPASAFVNQLIEIMVKLFNSMLVCEACAAALLALVNFCARCIDDNLEAASKIDALKQPLLRGAKRKLRLDEDYKVYMMETLVSRRRVLHLDYNKPGESYGRYFHLPTLDPPLGCSYRKFVRRNTGSLLELVGLWASR